MNIRENHSHIVLGAVSVEALRMNPSRKGIIMQNNGANTVYVTFGRPSEANSSSFKIDPAAFWVMAEFCPRSSMHVIGTSGGYVSIIEATNDA